MTIAVHFSTSEDIYFHCFITMARQQPETKFIFISSDIALLKQISFPNVKSFPVGGAFKNIIFKKYWIHRGVKAILEKEKPNFFFGKHDISPLCSETNNIIYFEEKNLYGKKKFIKSIQSVSAVLVPNEFVKTKLAESFPHSRPDFILLPSGAYAIPSLENHAIENIKKKWADNKEYFFLDSSDVNEQQIIQALQSFSAFKKWQHSNFKLALFCPKELLKNISDKLSSYKYREDVFLLTDKESKEIDSLIAASYAVIFLNTRNNISNRMLYSYLINVPILINENEYHQSYFQDAVLYYKENTLSEKMILIYKNEMLRNELIVKLREKSKELTWDKISYNLLRAINNKIEK